MGGAFLSGVRSAARHWPVVVMLFLVNLASGLGFSAAAWSYLSLSFDKSLAARSLLTDLNVQVFIDLMVHHRDGMCMLLIVGLVLAGFFVLIGVWLNAVVVTAVVEDASLAESAVRGFRVYPTYMVLWVLVSACNLAALAAFFLLGRQLTRWTAESPSEMTSYWIVGGFSLLGLVALFFLATVHDHARIRIAGKGVGALRAFGWACAFVAAKEGRALPLGLLLLGSSGVLWGVYQGVATMVATHAAFGVALSLLWGELLLLTRMFLRVWWFGAESALQRAGRKPAS